MLGRIAENVKFSEEQIVSKPYRYARKKQRNGSNSGRKKVSKPYRYARKSKAKAKDLKRCAWFQNLIGMLGSLMILFDIYARWKVSKPYRYARKK